MATKKREHGIPSQSEYDKKESHVFEKTIPKRFRILWRQQKIQRENNKLGI